LLGHSLQRRWVAPRACSDIIKWRIHMGLPSATIADFAEWWQRAVMVQNLKGKDLRDSGALTKALNAFVVGLTITVAVELAIVSVAMGSVQTAQVLVGVIFASNAILFWACLTLGVRVLRVKIDSTAMFCAVLYCFAAVLPILAIVSAEQRIDAIELFKQYRDPGLSYIAAATFRRLAPDGVDSPFAVFRTWLTVIFEAGVFFYYFVWNLRRVLVEVSFSSRSSPKLMTAILLSSACQASVVQLYIGRAYWKLIETAIK
jgi:hypothetical protein